MGLGMYKLNTPGLTVWRSRQNSGNTVCSERGQTPFLTEPRHAKRIPPLQLYPSFSSVQTA